MRMSSKVTSCLARRTCRMRFPTGAFTSLPKKVSRRPSKRGSTGSAPDLAQKRNDRASARYRVQLTPLHAWRRRQRRQRGLDLVGGMWVALLLRGDEAGGQPLPCFVAPVRLDEHGAAHEVHRQVIFVLLAQLREGGEGVVEETQRLVLESERIPSEGVRPFARGHLEKNLQTFLIHGARARFLLPRLRFDGPPAAAHQHGFVPGRAG